MLQMKPELIEILTWNGNRPKRISGELVADFVDRLWREPLYIVSFR